MEDNLQKKMEDDLKKNKMKDNLKNFFFKKMED
jgi:hypothetical protein